MSNQPTEAPPPFSELVTTDVPYRGLTPDVVLDALDSVSLRGDGRLIQLNSYENRVFQVFLEDGTVVVAKFYRPGRWTDAQILEEHAFSLELLAQEIPVVAPLALTVSPDFGSNVKLSASREGISTLATFQTADGALRFAVTPRCSGQAPELDNDDTQRWIGRFMGRMHAVGEQRPFLHRRTLNVTTIGAAARDWLVGHDSVPVEVASHWLSTVNPALEAAQNLFDEAAPTVSIRLHGDCHPGNMLWSPSGTHFVDLDDAVQGPAIQDLWMLLSGDAAAMSRQMSVVLSGYTDFMDFDVRELRLIEALRTLRMIHHSAWVAQRWNDPAFPIAFPWFGGVAYWQQQVTQLREQLELMRR
jgi:Ser/Thr protein kinase RdoA (MazF antagonist)